MRKKIAVFCLTTYALMLGLAALPSPVLPEAVEPFSSRPYFALASVGVLPGLNLFYRPYKEEKKIRGQCLTVKGRLVTGDTVNLYSTDIACTAKSHFFIPYDTYEVAFHRFMEEAYHIRHALAADEGEDALRDTEAVPKRELGIHQAMGDFFCHSAIARVGPIPLDSVYWLFEQETIGYESGERSNQELLLLKWNCERHAPVNIEWHPFIDAGHLRSFYENKTW